MSYRICCLTIAALLLLVQLAACQWENAQLDTITNNQVDDHYTDHSFVMSPDGTIHATWFGDDNGGFTIYKYRAPGQDWSPEEFVMLGTEDQGRATLPKDVRPDSAWMVGKYGVSINFYQRQFGGGWIYETVNPFEVMAASEDMTAVVDFQGRWHAAFVGEYLGAYDIYYGLYNGQTWDWQGLMAPLGDFGSGAAPDMVVDDMGIAHIFYRGMAWNYATYHHWNDDLGGTNWQWEPVTNPNVDNYTAKAIWSPTHGLCVAVSGNEGFGFPGHIYYHRQPLPSSTWLPAELVTGTHSAAKGQLALDSNGRPMIVWMETSGNFYTGNIYYAIRSTQWDNYALFQNNISYYPQVLMDSQDNGYLLFSTDISLEDDEIYFYGPEPQSNVPLVKSTLLPETAILHPVYPNPANASFNISYDLNSVQEVQLNLYDVLGQVVWDCYPGFQAIGSYNINITDDQIPSGTYFLELNTGNSAVVKTITIIK